MVSSGSELEPAGYAELLAELKARVRATRFRAARAANTEVLRLYWSVGRDILDRQRAAGWGSKVVTSLAADLQREFPDQRGWSRSNLLYMRGLRRRGRRRRSSSTTLVDDCRGAMSRSCSTG